MKDCNTALARLGSATRWSFLAEIGAKLLAPVTNGVLARLLCPEAFGMVATIQMVISFTDIFTDAGFQKFIIQHEFKSGEEKERCIQTAFWSNFALSLVLLLLLVIFRNEIAQWVGSPALGGGLAVAALALPITSFSSIQQAVFKRDMAFKPLFYVRMAGVLTPLIITIPLALVTGSYWALVIGSLAGNAVSAALMYWLSDWRPRRYFDGKLLKTMFSFCYWILLESLLIWATSYIGTFIVGKYISAYYLGIYKTSMTTVNQTSSLVTAAVSPVIFSVTSRMQGDREAMCRLFLNALRWIAMVMLPLGVGIYLYRDFITYILLGSQWTEAVDFIGLWGLCSAFGITLASFWDGMFNAIGKPKYSVLTQLLYLLVLVPLLLYGARVGYERLYQMRCLSRMLYIGIQLAAVRRIFHIKLRRSVGVAVPAMACCLPMILAAHIMQYFSTEPAAEAVQIIFCAVIYVGTALAIPTIRAEFVQYIRKMDISPMRKQKTTIKGAENG
jgi:PST family polysaccharide transporter